MKAAFKLIDKLIQNPTKINLMALDKVLALGIPFNAPHGFKFIELSDDSVKISLPNRKLNHNHLGGIHACAMATVGEFCAGMSLLKHFGISKYRLIMSEMHVTYTYQGRTNLVGSCLVDQVKKDEVIQALEADGKYQQTLKTIIRDTSEKEVAVVTTTWQLKAWDKVQTK